MKPEESWLTLLRDLSDRGMQDFVRAVDPTALGFWSALFGAAPSSLGQQCWFPKLGNVLKIDDTKTGSSRP